MRRLLLAAILFGAANAQAAPFVNTGPISYVELASLGQVVVPHADGRLAYDATSHDQAKAAAYERHPAAYERKADTSSETVASVVLEMMALVACGLIFALAAVGLRSLWVQHPIRDPYQESSEEGYPPAV
jgi:hypothetical protein